MMKRLRRSRKLSSAQQALDLTPMVDVVFLLIIFFMVSTSFITIENALPIDLPEAASAEPQLVDLPTVSISREQEILVAGAVVSFADLGQALEQEMTRLGTRAVILRADQSVPHGVTVKVMDTLKALGVERLAISTGG